MLKSCDLRGRVATEERAHTAECPAALDAVHTSEESYDWIAVPAVAYVRRRPQPSFLAALCPPIEASTQRSDVDAPPSSVFLIVAFDATRFTLVGWSQRRDASARLHWPRLAMVLRGYVHTDWAVVFTHVAFAIAVARSVIESCIAKRVLFDAADAERVLEWIAVLLTLFGFVLAPLSHIAGVVEAAGVRCVCDGTEFAAERLLSTVALEYIEPVEGISRRFIGLGVAPLRSWPRHSVSMPHEVAEDAGDCLVVAVQRL